MDTSLITALATVVFIYLLSFVWKKISNLRKASAIPAVGPTGIFTSYIGALRFYKHGREMIQEGYDKYHGTIFRIPMMTQWIVVVTGRSLIEDVRRATDDELSTKDAFAETFHTDILFEPQYHQEDYHINVVRTQLTRNFVARLPDIHDEIVATFAEYMPISGNGAEWTTVAARKVAMSLTFRATNRFFVGSPLCRDPHYKSLMEQFVIDMMTSTGILNFCPTPLRRLVGCFLRKAPEGIKRGIKYLEPYIRERLEQEEQYGANRPDRPNDALSWLLEVGKKPHQRTVEHLATRIMILNFASISTTTQGVMNTMFSVATHPEYVQPMREEIEAVMNEGGWSKSAITKLKILDSFLKESLRLTTNGVFTVRRKARKDFTLSNGVTIPAGHLVGVPHRSVHGDPEVYSNPDVFDGYRFLKTRENEPESLEHGAATLSNDYLPFGQGRHACPGRFFGVAEMKTMLAHLVMNYDIKMANDSGRPSEWWFGILSIADPTAKVMFRKRMRD